MVSRIEPDHLPVLGERPHRYFARIGSTNDEATAWALSGAPEGAVVLADEQTAGRGRLGRTWNAAPGSSLLMSVVLRPRLAPERLSRVTLMGAVALAEALVAWGLPPGIKWPNDVLIGGRKIAGILSEAIWSGEELSAVVLGMGVNVRADALPDPAALNAASVEAALGRPPDRWSLMLDLLARIDAWSRRLDEPSLLETWRAYSVTLGRRVTAAVGSETYTGTAEAIDEAGALLLRADDGQVRRLLAGDVSLHGSQTE